MKIATTTAEILPHLGTDFVNATRFYKGTGFRYLDFSFYRAVTQPDHPLMRDDWREAIQAVKKFSDEEGFIWVQAHLPACKLIEEGKDEGLEACLRAIEACGILGIENAVIHSSFGEGDFRYPQDEAAYIEANKPFFRALIPAMEKYGVNVLLENSCEVNTRGLYFPMTGADLNRMIEALDHPRFGACWDVGHANIQGLSHREELVTLGKNLKAVHIHDNNGQKDQHKPPFDGTMDFDDFMQGLIDIGFEGPFTFEVDGYLTFRPQKDEKPLSAVPLAVKHASVKALYETGCAMLAAYGIQGE